MSSQLDHLSLASSNYWLAEPNHSSTQCCTQLGKVWCWQQAGATGLRVSRKSFSSTSPGWSLPGGQMIGYPPYHQPTTKLSSAGTSCPQHTSLILANLTMTSCVSKPCQRHVPHFLGLTECWVLVQGLCLPQSLQQVVIGPSWLPASSTISRHSRNCCSHLSRASGPQHIEVKLHCGHLLHGPAVRPGTGLIVCFPC